MPRSLLRLSWYLWVGAAYPGDFSGRARTRSIRSGTPDSNRCPRRDSGADAVPAMLAHPETDRCHHIIPLRRKKIDSSRSPLSLFSLLPDRRLEIRFGKFSLADFFDTNAYGSYTTFQFMNWTVDNNGAYDDAADTRGFTFATMLEYHERCWAVRFAEALMPKAANGIHLDADMRRARAENIEFELPGTMTSRRDYPLPEFHQSRQHGQQPRSDRQVSRDHQEYLALGGSGFLLGDGRLNHRRGNIVETYYTLHVWRASFGLRHLNNPGYTQDRGPVVVPTLWLHLEF